MIAKTLLGILLLFLMASPFCQAEEIDWEYPRGGPGGASEVRAGKAGEFRTYHASTNDPVEKVVLWYTKKLRVADDHDLVKTAERGFSNSDNDRVIKASIGYDTDDRQDHTMIIAMLDKDHSHVTFLHRANLDGKEDVTISIASAANGRTSICVIRPLIRRE